MRRKRTLIDWLLWGFAAAVILASAWATFHQIIVRIEMRRDNDDLREQLENRQTEEPAATGGAEIPIPKIAPVFDWAFPIAAEDYLALTSPFGYRVSPLLNIEMHHQGLDIAATWRAQVVAVADGVVAIHWPPPGTPYPGGGVYAGHDLYGGMVTIEHADGKRTLYAHMLSTRVRTGDAIRAGEVIGRVGNTGKSDGEHLHFEVLSMTGERLNPDLYITRPQGELNGPTEN